MNISLELIYTLVKSTKTFYDVSDPFSRSQLSHLVQTSGNVSVRTGDYSVKVTLKHKALT